MTTRLLRNEIVVLERVKGNREAIGATLQDINGVAINLTGRAVTFRMVLMSTGVVKVNSVAATIVSAAAGTVSYTPAAGDVDTVGRYAMYFNDDSSPPRRWPYDGARFQLVVKNEETAE